METIRKIFFDDCKNLVTNFFALVIAVGVCFLPALYAWFNIYSNWDPYGNTGALKIAVYSSDKGYTNEDGTFVCVGDTVVENLHENTSVNWQFVESEQEAIDGVHDGTYYAAVVVGENFTYNMYNIFTEGADEPTLIFYENQKKNPVATKISDTVVATLQNNINESFVDVVVSTVFEKIGDVYDDVSEQGGVEESIDKLEAINDQLKEYQNAMSQIIYSNRILSEALRGAKTDSDYISGKAQASSTSLVEAGNGVEEVQTSLAGFNEKVNYLLDDTIASLNSIEKALEGYNVSYLEDMKTQSETVTSNLALVKETLNSRDPSDTSMDEVYADAVAMQAEINTAYAAAKSQTGSGGMTTYEIKMLIASVKDIKYQMNNSIIPSVNNLLEQSQTTIYNASSLMNSMSTTMTGMGDVFVAVGNSVDAANVSIDKTRDALAGVSAKLTDVIDKANAATSDEKVMVIIETLTGNPETYGEFFSEPVQIETESIYSIENYGSAVAPFYTTLAIWVGALILTAIIRIKPTKSKYPNATNTELYFGRYILFFVMAQLQALVIVLGDIYLLQIQCLHPMWFWVACSCAATTFSLLIYSLTLTFGDVGKAAAVVIVVLQIAGSSGTYPIELLPEFFQKVYIFFPFPYAINAMRECICGMYENDFNLYLLQLSSFIIVSLVIGILLKIPFEEINHYMEERMEDTEMM